MEGIVEAGTRCAGVAPWGFRANRFTENDDTAGLLDDVGFRYLERSARSEFFSVYAFAPYRPDGRGHAILPMPVRVTMGDVGSMCDTSARGSMTAAEFLRYERGAIDFHLRHGEPLVLEWHPSLTHPGNPDGWWATFLGVLDHLEGHEGAIRYVTARDLVEQHAPPEVR